MKYNLTQWLRNLISHFEGVIYMKVLEKTVPGRQPSTDELEKNAKFYCFVVFQGY